MQSNWQILQAYKDLQANIKPLEQEVALEEIITHFTWQLEEWATEEELREHLYEIVVFVRFLEIEFNKCHEETWEYDWCEAFILGTMKWFDSLYHYFLSAYHSDKPDLMKQVENIKESKDKFMKKIIAWFKISLSSNLDENDLDKAYEKIVQDWDSDRSHNLKWQQMANELRKKYWINTIKWKGPFKELMWVL